MPQLDVRPRLTYTVLADACNRLIDGYSQKMSLIDALDAATGEGREHEFARGYAVLAEQARRDGYPDLVEFDLDPHTGWTDRVHVLGGALLMIS